MAIIPNEVKIYIDQSRISGMPDSDIRQNLLNSGWDEHVILRALQDKPGSTFFKTLPYWFKGGMFGGFLSCISIIIPILPFYFANAWLVYFIAHLFSISQERLLDGDFVKFPTFLGREILVIFYTSLGIILGAISKLKRKKVVEKNQLASAALLLCALLFFYFIHAYISGVPINEPFFSEAERFAKDSELNQQRQLELENKRKLLTNPIHVSFQNKLSDAGVYYDTEDVIEATDLDSFLYNNSGYTYDIPVVVEPWKIGGASLIKVENLNALELELDKLAAKYGENISIYEFDSKYINSFVKHFGKLLDGYTEEKSIEGHSWYIGTKEWVYHNPSQAAYRVTSNKIYIYVISGVGIIRSELENVLKYFK